MIDPQEAKENLTTEERILLAAEQEFLEKGFAGARTTSIAQRAGVTHAMLHYYFRSKENLFENVISEKFQHLKQIIFCTISDSELSLFDRIAEAIKSHLDFIAANPRLPFFIINILSTGAVDMKIIKTQIGNIGQEVIAALQAEIDRSVEMGECVPTDASHLLIDIVSLNIFSFLGKPLLESVFGDVLLDDKFIEERKRNNVELILKKLRP